MTDHSKSLQDKLALITGGTSGIGLAIGHRFAQAGARLAVVGSSSAEKAGRAADSLKAHGTAAQSYVADVRRAADVELLIRNVESDMGPIDIVINSAGVWFPTPLGQTPAQKIDDMIDINLKGSIWVVAAVAPGMIKRRSGRIVNIASVAAFVPTPNTNVYVATKAAIIAFTRAAAVDLAGYDVAVNCISPGMTETPMTEAYLNLPEFADRREWFRKTTPSNRPILPAREIAEVALFLCDGRVNGIHGATIAIDEGRSAGLVSRA